MKLFITVFLLAVLMPFQASADSAAESDAFPFEEFRRIVEERKVILDADAMAVILEFADGLSPAPPEIMAVTERLRNGNATVSFKALLPLLTYKNSQAVCVKFGNHDDPLLRFIANVVLTGSGDSKAAQAVHGVIHDQSLSVLDKRLLKTWCDGVGIRAQTDDAKKILDHLTTAMSNEPKLRVGDTAPNFDTVTMSGRKLSSKGLKGKVIVLHFWATSCGPCLAQMPSHIKELSKYRNDEVEILFVSLNEDKDECKATVDKSEMPFSNVHDARGWAGEIARLFGVNSMPFDIVIDGTGKVVSNSIGDIDAALAHRRKP